MPEHPDPHPKCNQCQLRGSVCSDGGHGDVTAERETGSAVGSP